MRAYVLNELNEDEKIERTVGAYKSEIMAKSVVARKFVDRNVTWKVTSKENIQRAYLTDIGNKAFYEIVYC